LEQVLQHLALSGIHIQNEICDFCQNQIDYLSHCIHATRIHPTEKKIKAIKDEPVPIDVTQLRAFIGLMNYYGKFISYISHHCISYWKRIKSRSGVKNVRKCQSLLTSDAMLVHYDSKEPLKLACDASSYGGGGSIIACL